MTNLDDLLNDLPEGVHTVAGTAAEDLMLKVYLDGVATGAGTIVYSSLLNQDVPELCNDLYNDPLRRVEILTEIQERFLELPATGSDHPDGTEEG